MERKERLCCNRRECPQEPTHLQAAGNRCLPAEQEGLRSRHPRLLMFARYSFHQRRWRYSALRQFPDVPARLIRSHGLVDAESTAIAPGHKPGSQAAVGLPATGRDGFSNTLVPEHTV